MVIIKKAKILFVCPYFSSFIQKDLDLLKKHFDVKVGHYTSLMSIPKILKGVLWSDLTFSWFADTHAFWAVLLSKLFRKKSIVAVGGFEVAKVPEMGYGLVMLSPKSARRVKYVLENADKVLAVSEFNKKEILKCINHENIELVYNGIDCNKFKPARSKKEDMVITVAHTISDVTIKIKGLETFVKAAKYLPSTKFILIGEFRDTSIEHLKSIAPSNVEFFGFIPNKEMIKLYQKARVYCQLSYRESFGMALAEAMACECVPVVTERGAIPEVVGDTGFYVPYGDPEATAEAIEKALNSDEEKEARKRIKNMFPIERREKELKEMINNILLRDINKEVAYDDQK